MATRTWLNLLKAMLGQDDWFSSDAIYNSHVGQRCCDDASRGEPDCQHKIAVELVDLRVLRGTLQRECQGRVKGIGRVPHAALSPGSEQGLADAPLKRHSALCVVGVCVSPLVSHQKLI